MRVISPLTDLDLRIGRIGRQGDLIIVETVPGEGIETRIELSARDVGRIVGRILRSPALLLYLLTLPFLYSRAGRAPVVDPDDPWSPR